MFKCGKCAEMMWFVSLPLSYGKCEVCGKVDSCVDEPAQKTEPSEGRVERVVMLPDGSEVLWDGALQTIIDTIQADLDFNEKCHQDDGGIPNDDTHVIPRCWTTRGVLKNWIAIMEAFNGRENIKST